MARVLRFAVGLLLLGVSLLAFGQGSAAGGMGGGGFGGGGMSGIISSENREEKSRPEDEKDEGVWAVKSAILTPGEKVEFKIALRKGETLMAGVASESFDAALELEGPGKKVVAKNDDREEGDQSPFVIFRSPDEGDYTLRVVCFRPSAGGKFTLSLRTIIATDIPIGKGPVTVKSSPDAFAGKHHLFRIPVEKGVTYNIKDLVGGSKRSEKEQIYVKKLIGATGVDRNDFEHLHAVFSTGLFVAKFTGDAYVDCNSKSHDSFETDLQVVDVLKVSKDDKRTLRFRPHELKIVEFDVKEGDIVRSSYDGEKISGEFSVPPRKKLTSTEASGSSEETQDASWFRCQLDTDSDTIRIFHGQGTVKAVLEPMTDDGGDLVFTNRSTVPDWAPGLTNGRPLEIGESQYFLMSSKKSELMRVLVKASHFLPRVEIYRMNGQRANLLINSKTHLAGDDLYFPDAGKFLVRISCSGDGGSGDFTMLRESIVPVPCELAKATSYELTGSNLQLFSIDLAAGKRYQVATNTNGDKQKLSLVDDDGAQVECSEVTFGDVLVRWFVAPHAGRYRLWFQGSPGKNRFKIEPYVAPTLGGG